MAKAKAKGRKYVSPSETWDDKVLGYQRTQQRLWDAKREVARAEAAHLVAEAALARSGLAAFRRGFSYPGPWLTAWYNNMATSPRGDGPCVHEATEIPAGAEPVELTPRD